MEERANGLFSSRHWWSEDEGGLSPKVTGRQEMNETGDELWGIKDVESAIYDAILVEMKRREDLMAEVS